MKPSPLTLACLALLLAVPVRAADPKPAADPKAAADAKPAAAPAPAGDPDLPKPVDVASAQPLIDNPPFTRSLNLSDSLVLTGIAYIQGKPVATILNKSTRESYVISDEPNAQGWKLAETSASHTLTRTQAKLVIGSEIVTVRYSDEPISDSDRRRRPEGGEGGDRPRREGSSKSGTDDESRQRFMALSENARSKFIEKMRESREKMGNASSEDRTAYVKKIFDKVERDDKDGKYR